MVKNTVTPKRILEIITVPFFAHRGTSFSSLERTKALSQMGHSVDILTYFLGDPITVNNVRVHRIPRIPFIKSIPMGPSFKKLTLDFLLAIKTLWWLLFRGPFDLVLVHEESAYWVAFMRLVYRGPVLYDMHSSLVEQLANFGFSKSKIVKWIFQVLEKRALDRADGVIVICPSLEEYVRRKGFQGAIKLIENLPVDWDLPPPSSERIEELRRRYGLHDHRVLLYTGTFGKNQGIELALEALRLVLEKAPNTIALFAGATEADQDRMKRFSRQLDIGDNVVLEHPRPYTEMPEYMALADVLLSPRTEGTNTPLKIYSYLASGKPIVATALTTHTQVLHSEVAELVDVTPEGFAEGIVRLLTDNKHALSLGTAGQRLAEEKYGIRRYMQQVQNILEQTLSSGMKRA